MCQPPAFWGGGRGERRGARGGGRGEGGATQWSVRVALGGRAVVIGVGKKTSITQLLQGSARRAVCLFRSAALELRFLSRGGSARSTIRAAATFAPVGGRRSLSRKKTRPRGAKWPERGRAEGLKGGIIVSQKACPVRRGHIRVVCIVAPGIGLYIFVLRVFW